MDGRLNPNITVRRYAGATMRDLHIDVPLTNMTIAYRPVGLIAPQIYPQLDTPNETGNFYVWTKADFLRVHNAERARGAAANEINFSVSSLGYVCKNYALAVPLPLEDIANADAALTLRSAAANFATDHLNLAWEARLATTLTTTTNMASSTSLTNRWDDPVNGDPIEDWFTGYEAIRGTTGMVPNVGIFSGMSWNRFAKHPKVIDFVRGKGDNVGGGRVSEAAAIGALFPSGGGKILIGNGVKNTADEGVPATFADIWSTACILLHVAPNPGLMTPSHGYTFRWTPPGFPGLPAVGRIVDDIKHRELVETHQFQDENVTGSDLGYLIVNT